MATQICPGFGENSFTWYINDEPDVMHWEYDTCGYHALEMYLRRLRT